MLSIVKLARLFRLCRIKERKKEVQTYNMKTNWKCMSKTKNDKQNKQSTKHNTWNGRKSNTDPPKPRVDLSCIGIVSIHSNICDSCPINLLDICNCCSKYISCDVASFWQEDVSCNSHKYGRYFEIGEGAGRGIVWMDTPYPMFFYYS